MAYGRCSNGDICGGRNKSIRLKEMKEVKL